MYYLSTIFFEVRVFASTCMVIWIFVKIGMVDSILRFAAAKYMACIANLTVEVQSFVVKSISHVELRGIKVLTPPIEIDNRWECDCIVEVEQVDVEFDFFLAFLCAVLSMGHLLRVHQITVTGLKINAEGYEDPLTGQTIMNFSLLKTNKKRPIAQSCVNDETKELEYHLAAIEQEPATSLTVATLADVPKVEEKEEHIPNKLLSSFMSQTQAFFKDLSEVSDDCRQLLEQAASKLKSFCSP